MAATHLSRKSIVQIAAPLSNNALPTLFPKIHLINHTIRIKSRLMPNTGRKMNHHPRPEHKLPIGSP
jgi:hypothetical protein